MAKTPKKPRKLTKAEAGRLGGKETMRRHGRKHMVAIGKKGFMATCNKHYGGDRRAMLNELIKRGLASMDPAPWNGAWQGYNAFPPLCPDPPTDEPKEEDPVIAQVLASIRSAPLPPDGGL